MAIKICLNDQIHRFSKLPADFKALTDLITSTFQNQLPQAWTICYIDEEWDKLTLSTDQDYQELIKSHSQSQTPAPALKLYVIPTEELNSSSLSSISKAEAKSRIEEKKDSHEDYYVIEGLQEVQTNKLGQPDKDSQENSQNIREKTAQADFMVINDQSKQEVQPRACPQPLDEGLWIDKDKMRKARHLLKKLSKEEVAEEKKEKMLGKLKEIEESLTAEQKVRFDKKKQEWQARIAGMQSRSPRRDSSEKNVYKIGHIFKKLSKSDLPQEKRVKLTEKLKKIEESLTPEQKERFEERKQKWQDRLARRQSKSPKGNSGEEKVHKGKHIFKKLLKKDLPQERRAHLSEKLKKIEESLTPEEKALFEEKKQKWQDKFSNRKGKHCRKERSNQKVNEVQYQTDESGRPIHCDISCINCGVAPIIGVRYKCSVCHKFNLCEKCETTFDHPHPFLKIRNPAIIWRRSMKGRGKSSEDQFKIMKVFVTLARISEAAKRGDIEKMSRCRDRLLMKIPLEAKKLLDPVFNMLTDDVDQEALKKAIDEAKGELVNFYCPQDKERVMQEWRENCKKYHERREFAEKFAKKFSNKFMKHEKDEEMVDGMKSRKGRGMWKYPREVREKAFQMKEKLVDADVRDLCKFVVQAPEGFSVEELIVNYSS